MLTVQREMVTDTSRARGLRCTNNAQLPNCNAILALLSHQIASVLGSVSALVQMLHPHPGRWGNPLESRIPRPLHMCLKAAMGNLIQASTQKQQAVQHTK